MKGSSKVVMGTTMAIVIILAIVLGLVFVLLAELYCSLLFRRKKLNNKAGKAVSATGNPSPLDPNVPFPLSSFYAQGVLEAPRSFLFPKLPSKREKHHQITEHDDIENQTHGKLHQFLRVQSPRQIGIASSLPLQSPSPSYISLSKTKPHKPNHDQEAEIHEENEESFMYISNPMYDNDMVRAGNGNTPFETPDSSPSRLDDGSGSESEEEVGSSSPSSLPLTPMKNLPAKGGSIALRDARSLGSESNNSHIGRSSSSSASPCTSPSW